MKKKDWSTLNVAAWWKTHSLSIISISETAWLGDCPWQIMHEDPESRCTLNVSQEPVFSCTDKVCKSRSFASLTKNLWQDGQLHCKAAGVTEEDDGIEDKLYACGYTVDGTYYYQSGRTGHIRDLSPSQHKELYCYSIIPSAKFWKSFCGGDAEGISWNAVGRKMMALCHSQGYYSKSETRGGGIFIDRGRIVVNLGATLIVNDPGSEEFSPVNMADFKGDFSYASPTRITLPEPATESDLRLILPALEKLPFENAGGATIIAGAVICGYMAGALDWRPHFWLTGKPGSGKSEIMNRVLNALQPYHGGYFKGDTSAAGIRDATKGSSMLVRVDELEKMSGSSDRMSGGATVRRADQIIEMMRSASETSTASIAKGAPGGDGMQSQIRCCAFLSSIYHGIENAQDFRRFCFVTLNDPKMRAREEVQEYKNSGARELSDLFTPDFALKLYSWTVYNSRYILKMIDHFVSVMLSFSNNRGECDQWGTVLACAWCLTRPGEQPKAEDILIMFNTCHHNREIDKVENADLDHGSVAMSVLRMSRPSGERVNIGSQIDNLLRGIAAEGTEAWLEGYGLKVEKKKTLIIHPNHIELRKIMQAGGYSTYKQALLSFTGAKLVNRVTIFSGSRVNTVIEVALEAVSPAPKREITRDEVAQFGRQE